MDQLNIENENEHTVSHKCTTEKPNLKGDRINFYLLILLYTVQGFCGGLIMSISIILQSNKSVTFEDQALFSIVGWPYSIKILFAPIIDAFYVQRIGRRKFWLIILQLLMGVSVLILANNIHDWMSETENFNFKMIVIVVFFIMFFTAIQDIVVDGWSLEMLQKRNVGYSSISATVGSTLGMIIGSIGFTLLVSENFKSKFIETKPGSGGLLTMKTFLTFWAFFVFTVTVSVGIFKKETRSLENNHEKINVLQNYKLLWDILKLPRIRMLTLALMTYGAWTISYKTPAYLKLIDGGVPKDDLMMIKMFMYAVSLLVPIVVSKYVASPNSMSYFMKIMPFGFFSSTALTILVYYTPILIHKEGTLSVPIYYYLTLCFVFMINEMINCFMSSSLVSFFSQISDPRFGGTYMTLLNTIFNLGREIPNTFGLKLIGIITYSKCSVESLNRCDTLSSRNVCQNNGGNCEVFLDGYFIIVPVCIVIGLIWHSIFKNTFKKYQSLGLSHWIVYKQRLNTEEVMLS